ncbi:nucleotidyl transferase AbiEii/AbiGii toxin family protein [Parasphingorhabdus flavimaris]|jgi:predicted nucleotidyltransferase component of viral defense system|uniref:Nucleotidyl transferase AbiEii/AbiGii toxin family protein n=1 Tax=Parasphingorhabdus flavimaris TaxID=266812 RepID=A0ABX2N0K0_9SPHN|nr:nucleotidyl transferase AbiEii/AbiGii toxin family protein [Parasphingorhabdus flavimaris]NVD27199.1 nucleotidyl transferase AbiEii/AbiGii toxin family protein [Parasphingorhabdus flavimaris]
MAKEMKNIGASVRARLLNIARDQNQTFNFVLNRYAIERLLYRLSQSKHADRFVLKGATLLMTWFDEPFRGTQDLDLLGYGDPDPDAVLDLFREILAIDDQDGVHFDAAAARIDRIREEVEYGGVRVRTIAEIGGAKVPVSVDIGFGDATEPGAENLDFPVMLEMSPPKLQGYARETVIAEKFQAMVALGHANTRLKDYYDIWILSQSFTFEDGRLPKAIAATFSRRETEIPAETPDGLTAAFGEDPAKQGQWEAFARDVSIDPGPLSKVIEDLARFLMPAAAHAAEIAAAT